MKTMKTSELAGKALDWAVAKAEGWEGWDWDSGESPSFNDQYGAYSFLLLEQFCPSSHWAIAGPIIEREGITIIRCDDTYAKDPEGSDKWCWIPVWCATTEQHSPQESTEHQQHDAMYQVYEADVTYGPTPLVAAMRAYAARKLGSVVEVPAELLTRQLQAAVQAAWHAGLDAGREQVRGRDHARQPPSVPVVDRALEYLRPHLEEGTFSAPDWAIQLASILTGGDGCGKPVPPSAPVGVEGLARRIESYHWDVADKSVAAQFAAELRGLAQQPAAEAQPGWYCAQCQRGVDAREVTYSEQHEVCGRYIANDDPPRPRAPVGAAEEMVLDAIERRAPSAPVGVEGLPEEYYHTLIEKGGKVIGYGNVITENDWQIMGHENNRAICPPEEKWIGYKTIPFPHPTFIRMPPNT